MAPDVIAILDAFERAAEAVTALRAPVRRGRATSEDVRRHAARAAVRFYFDTIGKRTARVGLPGDDPEPPARVRPLCRDKTPHGKAAGEAR